MSSLLLWQRISAEAASIRQMLDRLPANDVLGRIGLEGRLRGIEQEITHLEGKPKTSAGVALIFHGRPVSGSYAIQAAFGSRAVDAFQQSVSTSYALTANRGEVGARGPTRDKDRSTLHITGLVHGSFGFVLEEIDPDGAQLVETTLKTATDQVLRLLEQISSEKEEIAEQAINEIDERLFKNIRDLVKLVHDDEASINLISDDSQIELVGPSLERAYQRVAGDMKGDEIIILRGKLLGLLPTSRRFEFRSGEEVIRGTVAKDISEEYLRTLESDPMIGHELTCKFRKRTFTDSIDNVRYAYVLIEVQQDDGGSSHGILART
jgi:hypothetical protein